MHQRQINPTQDSQIKSWIAAIADFNQGRYWHAHELFEKGWRDLSEPDRSNIKAIIQFCGVCVHLQNKRYDPALRLALRSLEIFSEVSAHQQLMHGSVPNPLVSIVVPQIEDVLLKVAAHLKVNHHDSDFLLSLAKPLKARLHEFS